MIIRQVINSVFNSCSYVVTQGQCSWLVDCGDVDKILPLIEGRLSGVLLTHTHFDHIYGLNPLLSVFPQVPIYTNEHGHVGLLSDKMNLSRYHENPFVLDSPDNIRVIENGTEIGIFGEVTAQAVFTPGHSPSCVTWVVGDAVFTGDSYIPGIKTVTIFPHADKALVDQSEALILDLLKHRTIYPGHSITEEEQII